MTAAKADLTAAEQARLKLVERDREISARITEVQQDMAAHVVRSKAHFLHIPTCPWSIPLMTYAMYKTLELGMLQRAQLAP